MDVKRVTLAEMKNRQWTESERQAIAHAGERQAAGDDSGIDCSDIPLLTDEQWDRMRPLREVLKELGKK